MDSRFKDDPNLQMLAHVATDLGELREQFVFLGGCATNLLITATRAQTVRVTTDVDVVAEVVSLKDYHALERQLASHGFQPDLSIDAPVCRHVKDGIRLDVMPSSSAVLGFGNRWYPEVLRSSTRFRIDDRLSVRLVAAPAFVATKLEAFHGRGRGSYLDSHDLEDMLSVVDGRDALHAELAAAETHLKAYVASEVTSLLKDDAFLDALPGHLPADAGAQQRLPQLLAKLRSIANLG